MLRWISEVKLENGILTGILYDFNSSGDYDNNLFFFESRDIRNYSEKSKST